MRRRTLPARPLELPTTVTEHAAAAVDRVATAARAVSRITPHAR